MNPLGGGGSRIRAGDLGDADAIARLLYDFNTEYDEPAPEPEALARRVGELLAQDQITVLLAGDRPDGLAVLRFRPGIWTRALECYLAELYVVPGMRRRMPGARVDACGYGPRARARR